MRPICEELQPQFNTRSGPTCLVCTTGPCTYGVSFCISRLVAPDPYVVIGIVPTCGTPECRAGAKEMNDMFRKDQEQYDHEKACKVCGKYEGSKRCAKCKAVVYCSPEHQKADWPAHKGICKMLASQLG